ncbi:MAG: glycosyltransferase family 2 protein [Deltaproteobacteria bacterium]|nr:glycosyltransferase family 2 protein [Deltaproteobacteria bacterium]
MRPALSILVPVFDEQANLRRNLPALRAAARACTPAHEILVVDDGSTDRSAEIVRRAARRDPRLRLVRHPRRLGPGAGVPTGLFWARGDWMALVPADLACEPADLGKLWAARLQADLVVGLRGARGDVGLSRRALSAVFTTAVRLLGRSALRQFTYIQMLRRQLFAELLLESRGVFVTAEAILRAEAAGCRLVQVPMRYRPRLRGRARGASPEAALRCGLEGLRFFGQRLSFGGLWCYKGDEESG